MHIVALVQRTRLADFGARHAAESRAASGNAGMDNPVPKPRNATRIYLVRRNINVVARHENYGEEMC